MHEISRRAFAELDTWSHAIKYEQCLKALRQIECDVTPCQHP